MTLTAAYISADIVCGPQKLDAVDIHKVMGKSEAQTTCEELGLLNHKKEFDQCIKELTTK